MRVKKTQFFRRFISAKFFFSLAGSFGKSNANSVRLSKWNNPFRFPPSDRSTPYHKLLSWNFDGCRCWAQNKKWAVRVKYLCGHICVKKLPGFPPLLHISVDVCEWWQPISINLPVNIFSAHSSTCEIRHEITFTLRVARPKRIQCRIALSSATNTTECIGIDELRPLRLKTINKRNIKSNWFGFVNVACSSALVRQSLGPITHTTSSNKHIKSSVVTQSPLAYVFVDESQNMSNEWQIGNSISFLYYGNRIKIRCCLSQLHWTISIFIGNFLFRRSVCVVLLLGFVWGQTLFD